MSRTSPQPASAEKPANRLTRNPDWLLHTDAAAAWIQYVTAYVGIVEIANLKVGETVMINAPSSSVGIAAIQIAKMAGAKPVAITTSPEKSNVLLGLGAVAVFSPTDAELPKKIDDLSGGFGARVIFDAVGGTGAALLQSAASVGAVHVIYGSLSDKNTDMSAMILYAKRMTVRGFQLFEATDDPSCRKAAIDFLFKLLKSGALKPVITKTFPLAQIVESHRYLESNQQIGKIVVTV